MRSSTGGGRNVGGWLDPTPEDVLYTCLPLFHTNALNAFVQALLHGARFTVGPRFSASRFWQRCARRTRRSRTCSARWSRSSPRGTPGPPDDRSHRVRVALAPATPAELWHVFPDRFGVDIVDGHGMTETNAVIGPRDGEQRPGMDGSRDAGIRGAGRRRGRRPVPDGAAGELVMRAAEPYAFASGYWRMTEATVAAWRNLWFHSGDRVVA